MKLLQNLNDWFQNLDIKNKLAVIVIEMAIFLIFVGLVGFYISYKENQRLLFQYENRLISIKLLNSIWANIRENEASLYRIILIPDSTIKKQLAIKIKDRGLLWLLELHDYNTIALHDPYEDAVLPDLQKKALEYTAIRDKAVQFALSGEKYKFSNSYFPAWPLLDNITNTLKDLSEYNDKMATKEYNQSIEQAKISYFIVFGSILFSLIIAVSFALLMSKSMLKSIRNLVEKMEQVALGNLDIEPIDVKYKDEIGRLSKSFNIMTDNLRRIILKEKTAREREDFLKHELEEQRSSFLSSLTHDLRSPLLAEQKAIEAILSKTIGESLDDFSEYLEEMYKTNDSLLRIVNNMLVSDYYESGKIELELEEKNIKDIISNAVKSIKPLIEENQSEIFIDIQSDLPFVNVNSDEITRVIINLVSNALKHNIKGVNIKISAKKIENGVQISISDNGKGIPDDEKPNIFEKYPTGKSKIGSGLGLYLSKQIINAHNGRIWFDTEKEKGTTFHFVLPI